MAFWVRRFRQTFKGKAENRFAQACERCAAFAGFGKDLQQETEERSGKRQNKKLKD
jgi:hypothetical protein